MAPHSTASSLPLRRLHGLYYGWIVLGVATLGTTLSSPGQTYAVSMFVEHIIADLGISRATISTLYASGTVAGSLGLSVIGRLTDRLGARRMLTAVSFLFGLACVFMSTVSNAVTLALGFFLIRMLGQGGLPLVCNYAINQWWIRYRGALLGASGTLVAIIGMGLVPNLIAALLPALGWRGTYIFLGVVLIVTMTPVAHFLVRNRPEEFGLLPDGDATPGSSGATAGQRHSGIEENWTLSQAMRTPVFWVFGLGVSCIAMLSTGLMFHLVSIFRENELSASLAARTYFPIAVSTAVGNLVSGLLVARVRLRALMALGLFFQAAALLLAAHLNAPLAIVFGVVLGTSLGLNRTINTVSWATYFGRLHLGAITGFVSTFMMIGSALGPIPLGFAYDFLGDYRLVLAISAAIPTLVGVASLLVDRPDYAQISS